MWMREFSSVGMSHVYTFFIHLCQFFKNRTLRCNHYLLFSRRITLLAIHPTHSLTLIFFGDLVLHKMEYNFDMFSGSYSNESAGSLPIEGTALKSHISYCNAASWYVQHISLFQIRKVVYNLLIARIISLNYIYIGFFGQISQRLLKEHE